MYMYNRPSLHLQPVGTVVTFIFLVYITAMNHCLHDYGDGLIYINFSCSVIIIGEETKNKHALKICQRIMRDATWINIHTLPVRNIFKGRGNEQKYIAKKIVIFLSLQQELKVIEIRTIEGYGVRWLHDGSEFRGFLEPQMEGGHSLGWRH